MNVDNRYPVGTPIAFYDREAEKPRVYFGQISGPVVAHGIYVYIEDLDGGSVEDIIYLNERFFPDIQLLSIYHLSLDLSFDLGQI